MNFDVEEGEQANLLCECEGVEPVKDRFRDGVEGSLVLLEARSGEAAQELFPLALEGLNVVAHGRRGRFEGDVVEGRFLGVVADEAG